MTKSDLIDVLCETQKLPKGRAELLVHVIFDALEAALKRGERIEIRGFGSFELRSYRGYDGRNPRTGSAVAVRPKRLPFFKVGKELKERVNDGRTAAPRAARQARARRRPRPRPCRRRPRTSRRAAPWPPTAIGTTRRPTPADRTAHARRACATGRARDCLGRRSAQLGPVIVRSIAPVGDVRAPCSVVAAMNVNGALMLLREHRQHLAPRSVRG